MFPREVGFGKDKMYDRMGFCLGATYNIVTHACCASLMSWFRMDMLGTMYFQASSRSSVIRRPASHAALPNHWSPPATLRWTLNPATIGRHSASLPSLRAHRSYTCASHPLHPFRPRVNPSATCAEACALVQTLLCRLSTIQLCSWTSKTR